MTQRGGGEALCWRSCRECWSGHCSTDVGGPVLVPFAAAWSAEYTRGVCSSSQMEGLITQTITPAETPSQAFQTVNVLSVAGAHALHDMYTSFVAPLVPILIASLAITKTQAGLMIFFLQTPALFQPLIGRLVDRIGLKPVVYLAPAITAVGMSIAGVAPSYTVLAVILTLVGINSAFFHSVGSVMSGTLSGRSIGRGKRMVHPRS